MTNFRHPDRRKGLTLEFEAFVRSVMACGCSARQARDTILLTVGFILPAALVIPHTPLTFLAFSTYLFSFTPQSKAVPLCGEVPKIDWFARQREAVGLEASLYAFLAVGELFPNFCANPFVYNYI